MEIQTLKTTFFGAMALLLSCALASAQPVPAKTEAQVLVEKCRAAYANLKTYRGSVKTNDVSVVDGEKSDLGGTAQVVFERPNLLRIDGKLAGGGDYSILGNADGAWYRWPIENEGKWQKADELSLAVASMTGVAGGAPTHISSLLLPALGVDPFRFGENAKIEGEEKIDGRLCIKITAHPKDETISWWIDKQTLLLRRVFASYDEKQSAAMSARADKDITEHFKDKNEPAPPNIEMRFVSDTEDLQVEELNGAVDERLFVSPIEKAKADQKDKTQ